MPRTGPFDRFAEQYDEWYDGHPDVFRSEVAAIRELLPAGKGLEVGAGTGRFAEALGIQIGIEPSESMRNVAQRRGLQVDSGTAEALPYQEESFDFVLMVTAICFVDDVARALQESYRVLKPGGAVVIGLIDRKSSLAERYEAARKTNPFYREATFFSTEELVERLAAAGFRDFGFRQTIFNPPTDIQEQEPVCDGFGSGLFVVIRGIKKE